MIMPLPLAFAGSLPIPLLISQGAEGLLYKTHHISESLPAALKHRPSKPYRHPILDKRLTRHRILSEARILVKCKREGVAVPGVFALDVEGDEGTGGWMMMEWIEGKTIRATMADFDGECRTLDEEHLPKLMHEIGSSVGKMHQIGVIHGDLTTSNMIFRPAPPSEVSGDHGNGASDSQQLYGKVVLIDFGLAGQAIQDEDRAVDLYVLERAFASTHPKHEQSFQEVLKAYGNSYKGAKFVLKRLEDVRMRGRKRSMVG